MRHEGKRERKREEILRILWRHVQTSFWKATPFHGRSFERLEKAIVLSLFLSLFPSFFLSTSDLSSTRDSIVLSRSTGTRPRAAVNFYLSVRSCLSTSPLLPRMKTNIFLKGYKRIFHNPIELSAFLKKFSSYWKILVKLISNKNDKEW